MKVIAILAALLAVTLAAPSEPATTEEKIVVVEKTEDTEKPVQEEEAGKPLSESSNEEKIVDKPEDTPSAEVASPEEEEEPPAVAATPVKEEETDEKIATEEEKQKEKEDYGTICRASTGATQEEITKFGSDPSDDAPKAVKCYVQCLGEHYMAEKDLQSSDPDTLRRYKPSSVTYEEFKSIVDSCPEIPKTEDPCDSAYLRYACIFRSSGKKLRIA